MSRSTFALGLAGALLLPVVSRAAPHDCMQAAYYLFNSDGSAVIADCTQALTQTNDDQTRKTILGNRANAYAAVQHTDEALADFDEAIRLDPADASAYVDRASFYRLTLADLPRALADLDTAIKLKPDSSTALSARASLFERLEQPDRAAADYNAAVAVDPADELIRFWRGDFRRQQGDYQGALDDFSAAVKVQPDYTNAQRAAAETRAVLALGPTLAVGTQPLPASRFLRDSAAKDDKDTLELWTLDGKPHHCAWNRTGHDLADAVGRSETGYALTLSSADWLFQPGLSYAAAVRSAEVSQAAIAVATDANTVGLKLDLNSAVVAKWRAAKIINVVLQAPTRAGTTSVDVTLGDLFEPLDQCWQDSTRP